ncbi:hybrid sensor histidine kinase/response regulator [Azospirillum canadense]|uniref:hybrid sensor histidine kinase/response regulator n=1 Tax=Azospirillum canadense TaxID=403962 RepID=UPI002225E42E|nr:MHYT domain-containing protein [Azospirillum canadense]MCW2239245.1 PAS domain S-box-containing protein [Azospirillum canadense]
MYLVALSLIVAVFGGFVALDLGQRARHAVRHRRSWVAAAAAALGVSVWSMHFIGMLALQLPVATSHDLGLTALSLALATVMSGVGFFAVAGGGTSVPVMALAGTVTGLGIVAMHYVGMAGLQVPAAVSYDARLVGASILIAIVASTGALWLAFRRQRRWQRLAGAVVLGLAITCMHYTGMAAAVIAPLEAPHTTTTASLSAQHLATGTALGTLSVLALAFAAASIDRRRAATRAAEQEARYRAVVDTAGDPIIVTDEHGRITAFNRAAERVFGYSASDVIDQPVSRLLPTVHGSAQEALFALARQAGDNGREIDGRRKDGTTVPLELSVAAWHAEGARYVTSVLRDITERKAFEEDLRRAKERAEKADAAKTQFLAAAGHDLRQPVQSLYFLAHALADRRNGPASSDLLASVGECLDALKLSLDSMLDMSKLDAGVVQPCVTEFAVAPLLARIAADFGPRAAVEGVRLRVVPSSAWTRSDPLLLERMLRNLVENALRFTPQGSVVVGCRRAAGELRIDVADNGIGIDAAHLPAIWEEFYQIGNPERDRRKGLGLGLAIVKRLARTLGHAVVAHSRLGRGTIVSIGLPRVPARAVPTGRRPRPANDDGKGLVVVVEDDTVVLLTLSAMLEEWGYEVIAAPSGDEAVHRLKALERVPRAIIADYRLGEGRTGVETIRDLHKACGVKVPAFVLTGDTTPERLAEVERNGLHLLRKPLPPDRLHAVLATVA